MRAGVRLAVDVGAVRIGVARCDATGTLAVPEVTLLARSDWLAQLRDLVDEYEPIEILIGLPVSLDGRERAAAEWVHQVVADIAQALPQVALRLIDERLTTTIAHNQFRETGVTTRKGRGYVDQVAAVIMLQGALDSERSSGNPPGTLVNGQT